MKSRKQKIQANSQKEQTRNNICPGNIRLFLGLFRTQEEQDAYIKRSLQLHLP